MRARATQPIEVGSQPAQHAPVILLVEDESIVREVTREVLTHAGYSVLESSTPGEALDLARRHAGAIDLLLTDMVMPGMNGAELATRLRIEQPNVVILFMSGYSENDVMRKLSQGAAIHIQKPFTVDMLLTRVGEALQAGVSVG